MSLSEKQSVDEIEQDDFCKIDSIGPATEKKLKDEGLKTFKDLSELSPTELHSKFDIVLATATKIISGAVNNIEQECPMCYTGHKGNFSTSWSVVLRNIDSDSDLVCGSCGWDGTKEELE